MRKIPVVLLVAAAGLGAYLAFPLFRDRLFPPRRPNIILISFDTLRPDRLSCFGYAGHRTPNFDALAASGCLFTRAATQYTETLASHMTLMTSMYASVHGLLQEADDSKVQSLNPALSTIASWLKDLGYDTVGITGGGYVGGQLGFSRGFDEYYDTYDRQGSVRKIFDRAVSWLEKNRPKKFFMFLHTWQVHAPYDPPPEFLPRPESEYAWEHRMIWTNEYQEKKKRGEDLLDPRTPDFLAKLNELYDGEVLFCDRELGALVGALKRLGLWDDLILILVSDHGESLGEKGLFGHSNSSPSNTHALMLCRFPDSGPVRQPQVIAAPAALADLFPTLRGYLKAPRPRQPLQGENLIPLLRGAARSHPPVYSEYPHGAVVQDGRYAYVREDSGKEFLYDLETDPDGKRSLIPAAPGSPEELLRRRLSDRLLAIQERNRELRKEFGPGAPVVPGRLDRNALKSLGYL